jgi:protocatechuate 3,4-dioxygenase beta subunit
MQRPHRVAPTRRQFLTASLAAPALAVLATRAWATARSRTLAATPGCPATSTPAQTEGPYFKPSSPERASLVEPGIEGTRIVVSGRVLTTDCVPVPRALIDVWQANDRGEYDNAGFRLRGHQFTDADGRYRLETIVPGIYPGRTRHIHVKVQAPGGPVLTTQLYFPGEAQNRRDGIFDPALVMATDETAQGKRGTFDFVVNGGRNRSRTRPAPTRLAWGRTGP